MLKMNVNIRENGWKDENDETRTVAMMWWKKHYGNLVPEKKNSQQKRWRWEELEWERTLSVLVSSFIACSVYFFFLPSCFIWNLFFLIEWDRVMKAKTKFYSNHWTEEKGMEKIWSDLFTISPLRLGLFSPRLMFWSLRSFFSFDMLLFLSSILIQSNLNKSVRFPNWLRNKT